MNKIFRDYILMAGETRLELAAFCVTGRCYNQLNYSPEERLTSIIRSIRPSQVFLALRFTP